MKLAAFLLWLLVPLGAGAQTFLDAPCVFRSFWTPAGTGTEWIVGTQAPALPTGVAVSWWAWWCPLPDGTWKGYVVRCIEGRTCLSAAAVSSELDTAARSADKLVALRAAMAKYQGPPLDSERPDWDRAGVAAQAALNRAKPGGAVTRWITAGTLSVYTTLNGAIARLVLGKKAPAGVLCSGPAIVSGSVTYMAYAGGLSNEVTTCKASP